MSLGRARVRGRYLDGGPAVLQSESPTARENHTMKKPARGLRMVLVATFLMASGVMGQDRNPPSGRFAALAALRQRR